MLEAAEQILDTAGPDKLTLRAAGRVAGVSHTAAAHHFGDLKGLLSELAALGFLRFSGQLQAAAEQADDHPRARLIARGKAYVAFARRHPGLFQLMFRGDRLDRSRPALKQASASAFAALRESSGAARHSDADDPLAEAIGAWSIVHGFAMLMIEGQLPPGRPPEDLLDAILSRRRG